jgi:hypothetical protein
VIDTTNRVEAPPRPLKENPGVEWDGSIVMVTDPHTNMESPGYQWLLRGKRTGFIGGSVIVLPTEGIILFENVRPAKDEKRYRRLESKEEVLKMLDEFGWGKPPKFDTICESIREIQTVITQGGTPEDIKSKFGEIGRRWQAEGIKIHP